MGYGKCDRVGREVRKEVLALQCDHIKCLEAIVHSNRETTKPVIRSRRGSRGGEKPCTVVGRNTVQPEPSIVVHEHDFRPLNSVLEVLQRVIALVPGLSRPVLE